MSHVWKRCDVHTGFWWQDLRDSGHLEDLGIDGRKYQNGSSRSGMGKTWNELNWHRIGTGCGLL